MNLKIKILFGVLVLASAIILIGLAFGPLDPFPRARQTAQCKNSSSVVRYVRKVGWLSSKTEVTIGLTDPDGRLIREDRTTFPKWNDARIKATEKPDVFCDSKNWPQREFTTGGGF
jgi:hypothetical protein